MFVLYLNPVTGRAEDHDPVARASSRESLTAFVDRERVAGYWDGKYHKVFRRGGPLEWYNPPPASDVFFKTVEEVPSEEEVMRRAAEARRVFLAAIPEVP